LKRWWLAVLVPVLAGACGDEGPTDVGAGLLPPNAIRTFEVFLEPERYLVFDTAFGLYSEPRDAIFLIVADRFDDALDARGLARFNLPLTLSVIDTLGVGRVDSVPTFVSGTVRMAIDTLRSAGQPVRVSLYRTAEAWTPSATWLLAADDDDEQRPWAVPGGTLGVLVDTATVTAGRDSLVLRVDSATLAAWADTADATRGAVFVAETPGGRIRLSMPILHVEARSGHRPDTLYTATAVAPQRTFIFTPSQPTITSQPRVGGTPAWRTVLRFRERLDTLSFACPGVPNCRFRLSDANLNQAVLQLQPVAPPAGFRPEGDLSVVAYLLLPTPQIPLQRSPLGDPVGLVTVPQTSFTAPAAPVVSLSITELVRTMVLDPAERTGDFVATHVALVGGEPRTFGFGTFSSLPTLRLVISITREMQLP
jgi:hypothetical protein